MNARVEEAVAAAAGVVFDFGGVISFSPLGDGWELYPYCARLGLDRAAVDAGWKNYRHLWDGGRITFEEMYRRTFADAGRPPPTARQLEELWEVDPTAWIRDLCPKTLELMRAVKAAGKKVGLLSNMSPDFFERLFAPRAAAYRELLDVEVISGLVKLYKPEEAIYRLTEREMGLQPEKLVFLDDTEANVLAARSFGWNAEVYRAEH